MNIVTAALQNIHPWDIGKKIKEEYYDFFNEILIRKEFELFFKWTYLIYRSTNIFI